MSVRLTLNLTEVLGPAFSFSLSTMNQFDALMGQISDLEGVNRDAERKIVAVTQHSNSLEAELSSGTYCWS